MLIPATFWQVWKVDLPHYMNNKNDKKIEESQ